MPASVITYAARHQTNAHVPATGSAQHNTILIHKHTHTKDAAGSMILSAGYGVQH
jgi:hypothetical protein